MRIYKILDGKETISQGNFTEIKEWFKPKVINNVLLTEDYRDAEEIDELMPIVNLIYNSNYTWEETND